MSRSGYYDDECDPWALICYRGAVASAIRGKRGQDFLKEMAAALDAMPEKRLTANELEIDGQVCAIGAVGRARGIDMDAINPEDPDEVADVFGINEKLAREIVWVNDEAACVEESPEDRFKRVRNWVALSIRTQPKENAA